MTNPITDQPPSDSHCTRIPESGPDMTFSEETVENAAGASHEASTKADPSVSTTCQVEQSHHGSEISDNENALNCLTKQFLTAPIEADLSGSTICYKVMVDALRHAPKAISKDLRVLEHTENNSGPANQPHRDSFALEFSTLWRQVKRALAVEQNRDLCSRQEIAAVITASNTIEQTTSKNKDYMVNILRAQRIRQLLRATWALLGHPSFHRKEVAGVRRSQCPLRPAPLPQEIHQIHPPRGGNLGLCSPVRGDLVQ